MNAPYGFGEDRFRRAVRLLADAGFHGPCRWTRLTGGANNRIFRIDLMGRTALLKAYFVHPDDPRDRLGAEYGFAGFAWEHGLRTLAQPIACDLDGRLALYGFIRGRKLAPEEVTWPRVREALDFFRAVNAWRDAADAGGLPAASEACFTLEEHLDCVRRRVVRLQAIEGADAVDREARAFIHGDLSDCADAVIDQAYDQAAGLGLAPTQALPAEDRCLSPSDFGFHNALLAEDGRLRFIDFEYAGWDDPAKTVADFFCQPERPAPLHCLEDFTDAVMALTTDPELHRRRCRLLLPVYQLKWCCILLNDFLTAGGQRRCFAQDGSIEGRKARQLLKARAALNQIMPLVIHGY